MIILEGFTFGILGALGAVGGKIEGLLRGATESGSSTIPF